VTRADGVLEEITMNLGTGTYYLREKTAPDGYKSLSEDLCFTIGEDGKVLIHNDGYSNWLVRDTSVPGTVSYQISIENTPLGITLRKTDENGKTLSGSKFVLCKKNDYGSFVAVTGIDGITEDGLIDLTDKTEMTFTGMSNGDYMLSEVEPPAGYIIKTKDIYFSIYNGSVTLTDENGDPTTYTEVVLRDDNSTIVVKNVSGVPLPNTGGMGANLIYLLGIVLVVFAGAGLICKRICIL
jgi:LPXTG-motif cell wall-anchored protein